MTLPRLLFISNLSEIILLLSFNLRCLSFAAIAHLLINFHLRTNPLRHPAGPLQVHSLPFMKAMYFQKSGNYLQSELN